MVARLRRRFPIGKEARADFHYVGVHVRCKHGENGYLEEILVDQEDFVDELGLLSENKGVKQETAHRDAVGSLLWASSTTRTDLALDVALLSGATSSPTLGDFVPANKTVKRAKCAHVTLRYPRVRGPLHLVGYSDAAWANLSDGKTGGGVFICLADGNGRSGGETFWPICWPARRLKRVVHSMFAS